MIAISCQYNDSFASVADLTVPIMQEYCDRHGYHLLLNKNRAIKRSIVWDRYDIILENLTDYYAIVHMDCDLVVTNHYIRIEDLIDRTIRDIIISRAQTEQGEWRFNDGVAIFRNSLSMQNILQAAWEIPDDDFVKCGQDALELLWRHGKAGHFNLIPQKSLNSFLYSEYSMPETTPGNWTPGDFVLHMPGRTNERRCELIHETIPKIIR